MATRTISLKVEVSDVAKILDKAIATGVNEVEGIEYAISDDSKIRKKLLGEAIENAKEQAGFLAKAFDAKLGKCSTHYFRSFRRQYIIVGDASADGNKRYGLHTGPDQGFTKCRCSLRAR